MSNSPSEDAFPDEGVSHDEDEESWDYSEPFRFCDLPTELQIAVAQQLDNLKDVTCLSLACKEFRTLFAVGRATVGVRDRFVAALEEYYSFLTTLHIPEADHVRPPPGGWPNITPEKCKDWGKTDFAIDVIRHLPYIRRSTDPNCSGGGHDYFNTPDYKCELIDYSVWKPGDGYPGEMGEICFSFHEDEADYSNDDGPPAHKHRIILADGHESGGVSYCLDTLTGWISEEIVRHGSGQKDEIEDYFSARIDKLRNLEQVFVPGREPLDGPGDEEADEYDPQAMEIQGEPRMPGEYFGGIDDHKEYYWVRHLYRKHGWPEPAWKKAEGLRAVREYFEVREAEG